MLRGDSRRERRRFGRRALRSARPGAPMRSVRGVIRAVGHFDVSGFPRRDSRRVVDLNGRRGGARS